MTHIYTTDEDLEGSRALPIFLREYADLIERGHARPFTPHNDKSRVVFESKDDVISGGIVYNVNRVTKVGWIVFSFTVQEFLRTGVYTRLHRRLESILKEGGMTNIASHVHVSNTARLESCRKVGMSPVYYRMNKRLESPQ
jgi:hypothetical protein